VGVEKRARLNAIQGTVPSLTRLPRGCRFRDRCALAIPRCAEIDPPLEEKTPGHEAACIRSEVLLGEAAAEARP
jgi:peptide/nickel transport system ATP-binding protein